MDFSKMKLQYGVFTKYETYFRFKTKEEAIEYLKNPNKFFTTFPTSTKTSSELFMMEYESMWMGCKELQSKKK